MSTIKIISDQQNVRLDKYLTQYFANDTQWSRTYIQKIIKNGNATVNEEVVTNPNHNLVLDDVITILPLVKEETNLEPEKIDFEIVYEDEYLLVINKPNNLVVHPGNGNETGTLVNGLLDKFNDLSNIGTTDRPGIVHRIDKQTTGLLIIAKNDLVHNKLSQMFANHEIYKEYLALVWHTFNETKGMIDAPIGRNPQDRKKMMVTSKNSKNAKTNFEVIEKFEDASLVRCSIETGRTHQIRVHFQFIKHPVMNDPIYGLGKEKKTDFGQYLHAHKISFIHPIKNEEISLVAQLPSEFNDKINKLRG